MCPKGVKNSDFTLISVSFNGIQTALSTILQRDLTASRQDNARLLSFTQVYLCEPKTCVKGVKNVDLHVFLPRYYSIEIHETAPNTPYYYNNLTMSHETH